LKALVITSWPRNFVENFCHTAPHADGFHAVRAQISVQRNIIWSAANFAGDKFDAQPSIRHRDFRKLPRIFAPMATPRALLAVLEEAVKRPGDYCSQTAF